MILHDENHAYFVRFSKIRNWTNQQSKSYGIGQKKNSAPLPTDPSECIFIDVPNLSGIFDVFLFPNNRFSSNLSVLYFPEEHGVHPYCKYLYLFRHTCTVPITLYTLYIHSLTYPKLSTCTVREVDTILFSYLFQFSHSPPTVQGLDMTFLNYLNNYPYRLLYGCIHQYQLQTQLPGFGHQHQGPWYNPPTSHSSISMLASAPNPISRLSIKSAR
jgi:hypothetical protein